MHGMKLTCFTGILVLSSLSLVEAQLMPQDSWVYSRKWGNPGTNNSEFNAPLDVAIAPDGRLFVADTGNRRIQVFEADGTFVRKWGSNGPGDGQFYSPVAVAVAPDGRIIVADTSINRIQVFEPNGAFVRKWGVYGALEGQFKAPSDVAVAPDGRVIVADTSNRRIQVFEADGTFVRSWGAYENNYAQFSAPQSVDVDSAGRIYVVDRLDRTVQSFTPEGTFLKRWSVGQLMYPGSIAVTEDDLLIVGDGRNFVTPPATFLVYEKEGALLHSAINTSKSTIVSSSKFDCGPDGQIFMANNAHSCVDVLDKSGYRVAPQMGIPPMPIVIRCEQQADAPYLDIDYVIRDSDSPTVEVAVAAFSFSGSTLTNGLQTLTNFVRIASFVDGTESAVGPLIPANVTNRISWNVAADWAADYVNLKVRVMAKDDRGLLALGFITLPGFMTNQPLTISSSPVTQSDMLPLWFWLLAKGDPALTLNNGTVTGVGGAYQGVNLASGTNTTTQGRGFLFERLGVRLATTQEVNLARLGMSGATNQWAPRITVGPGIRPKAVNEIGFDTGNWGVNAWWVVKE